MNKLFEASTKRYHFVLKGITPIRQGKRYEIEFKSIGGRKPTPQEEKARFEASRYYDKKKGYYQPGEQVRQALILAAAKAKVPGEGNLRFTNYVGSGILIEPANLYHKNQKKDNIKSVVHPTVHKQSGKESQIWVVKPEIKDWQIEGDLINLHPEKITDDFLKQFFEYAGMFCGLGMDRPARGKNCGRFELIELELIKNKK